MEVEVGCAGLHLGRGPLLRIDASNISRKHAFLATDVAGKTLAISCLHRTPITVLSQGVEKHLGVNEKVDLHQGDVIKFSPDKFHFGLEIPQVPAAATATATDPAAVSKAVGAAKKRELPDWMKKGAVTGTSKGKSPAKKMDVDDKENTAPRLNPAQNKTPTKGSNNMEDLNLEEAAGPSHQNKPPISPQRAAAEAATKRLEAAGAVGGAAVGTDVVAGAVTGTEAASAVATKFPTVITAADFQDSDEEEAAAEPVPPPKKKLRVHCRFGGSCYRKNPAHFRDESHPGDDDYDQAADDEDEDDGRPECEYGVDCYRKNPSHKRNYKHTHKPQPKRVVKQVKAKKKDGEDDEYESDFIDDDEMDEPIDDTDEDENWAPNDTDTD